MFPQPSNTTNQVILYLISLRKQLTAKVAKILNKERKRAKIYFALCVLCLSWRSSITYFSKVRKLIFFVYPDPPAGGERRKSIYSPWGWGK
jgi:hypothetical protein